jgi:hypothetical protein
MAVTLVWALVAWLTAAFLSMRLGDRAWIDALTWYYAVRAPLIATVLALPFAPLLCKEPLEGKLHLIFPRRARITRIFLWSIQNAVLGLLMGILGTFLLLFCWPNDAQNQRIDAYKWVAFYWYNHGILLVPFTILGAWGSSWLGRRFAA